MLHFADDTIRVARKKELTERAYNKLSEFQPQIYHLTHPVMHSLETTFNIRLEVRFF